MSVEPVETPIQSILCAVLSCSVVSHSVALWTVALQAPLSMGFSREEYWSGLPCPFPGDLSNPGSEPRSPTLQLTLYHLSHKQKLKPKQSGHAEQKPKQHLEDVSQIGPSATYNFLHQS